MHAQRLELLGVLDARGTRLTVRKIVAAFLQPLRGIDSDSGVPWLIGRLHGEPQSVSLPLLEREFSEGFDHLINLAVNGFDPDRSKRVSRIGGKSNGRMAGWMGFDSPTVGRKRPGARAP